MSEFDFSKWECELHFMADTPKELFDQIMGYDHPERLFEPGNIFAVGTADGKREARYVCISEDEQKRIEELARIVAIVESAREEQYELYKKALVDCRSMKAHIHGTHVEFCDKLLKRIEQGKRTEGRR